MAANLHARHGAPEIVLASDGKGAREVVELLVRLQLPKPSRLDHRTHIQTHTHIHTHTHTHAQHEAKGTRTPSLLSLTLSNTHADN